MAIRHIIFDIDGTLLDTKHAFLSALEQTLDTLHIPHGDLAPYFSLPLSHAVRDFALDEQTVATWEEDYAFRLSQAPLYDGVHDLILALSDRGMRLALITSRKHNIAHLGLDVAGLLSKFDIIIAADDVTHPKPNAEPLDTYRKYADCEKSEMIFIGDSEADLSCAKNAGVAFFAPGWAPLPCSLHPYAVTAQSLLQNIK